MTSMKLTDLMQEMKDLYPIEPSTYKNWLKAAGPLGDIKISDVDKQVVKRYRMLQLKHWAPTTLTTRISSLKGLWNKAIEWEMYDGQNPWLKAAKGLKNSRRDPDFHPWEYYEYYHNDPYFVCLWYTGMRISEIAGIYKQNIVTDAAIPYFDLVHQPNRKLKNDPSIRKVPIHPACMPYVERLYLSRAVEPGKSWSDNFRKNMKLPLGVGAHSLRHSFTSRMNEAGCIDRIQDALLGHAPATLTGRYGKVTLEMKYKEILKLK
jgi:integrase